MKFPKILILLGIGCIAVLLIVVFGVKLQAQNRPSRESFRANMEGDRTASRSEQFRNRQQGSNWGSQRPSNNENNETSKDSQDFYKVIIDNNIFRPLGWRPPNKEPEYSYIGTTVNENAAKSEAYVHERRSNKFYMVTIGDNVGDAVVKEITEKEIILDKNGETITLRGGNSPFISTSGSNRGGPSRTESNDRDESANNRNSSRSSERASASREASEARRRAEESMRRAQEMRRRFEGASREQREQMMRQFSRERGGFRGRRGGDR